MKIIFMIFGFTTILLLFINILIARRIIKVDFIWHKRLAYTILLTGLSHFSLILFYYREDLFSIKFILAGGVFTYILLIIQILIGKNIIKLGIKYHKILGYILFILALNHGVLALLYRFGIISF